MKEFTVEVAKEEAEMARKMNEERNALPSVSLPEVKVDGGKKEDSL